MLNQQNKNSPTNPNSASVIPEKLYFTIGEVSKLCHLKPHVLRYWEQEFSQLTPSKRRGNRRYYQRKDVLLIRQIKDLLYQQGYTIEGARQKISTDQSEKQLSVDVQQFIRNTLSGLEEAVTILEAE